MNKMNVNVALPDSFSINLIVTISTIIIALLFFVDEHKNIKEKIVRTVNEIVAMILNCLLVLSFMFLSVVLIIIVSTTFESENITERDSLARIAISSIIIFVSAIIPTLFIRATNIASKKISLQCLNDNECSYSVTGTCIPFRLEVLENENRALKAFMIEKAYEESDDFEWMFPGGHAFKVDENNRKTSFSPERIAVEKTRTETSLEVNLINKVLPSPSDTSGRFELRAAPQYTYLFNQKENAPCYKERGHLHHFDMVYIGDVYDKASEDSKYKVAEITLDTSEMSREQIANAINSGIQKIYEAGGRDEFKAITNSHYQVYMLCEAHKDYIAYKREEGVLK
jgi:hypothetical protein